MSDKIAPLSYVLGEKQRDYAAAPAPRTSEKKPNRPPLPIANPETRERVAGYIDRTQGRPEWEGLEGLIRATLTQGLDPDALASCLEEVINLHETGHIERPKAYLRRILAARHDAPTTPSTYRAFILTRTEEAALAEALVATPRPTSTSTPIPTPTQPSTPCEQPRADARTPDPNEQPRTPDQIAELHRITDALAARYGLRWRRPQPATKAKTEEARCGAA
jgi:hypothetical protein